MILQSVSTHTKLWLSSKSVKVWEENYSTKGRIHIPVVTCIQISFIDVDLYSPI